MHRFRSDTGLQIPSDA
uniref:Uncharacterized protein n=1 Tax=Anguilla anguilla TaxID=7936 RepID=A0A0E9UDK1_ANGAN